MPAASNEVGFTLSLGVIGCYSSDLILKFHWPRNPKSVELTRLTSAALARERYRALLKLTSDQRALAALKQLIKEMMDRLDDIDK